MIENIPGLYFIGNQKKPNNKIKVEHVIEEYSSDIEVTRKTGSDHEDMSITDSTTSKFEKIEKNLEKLEERKKPRYELQ